MEICKTVCACKDRHFKRSLKYYHCKFKKDLRNLVPSKYHNQKYNKIRADTKIITRHKRQKFHKVLLLQVRFVFTVLLYL